MKLLYFFVCLLLIIKLINATTPTPNTNDNNNNNNNNKNIMRSISLPYHPTNTVAAANENDNYAYFLVSTSTKIYCIKTYFKSANDFILNGKSINDYIAQSTYYEIIYEELNSTNNWITDLYYNKNSSAIYVNVYDSTTFKSDIFQLEYNSDTGKWVKNILFRDQVNCLGITYNEDTKEIYWTSGRTIMAGSIGKKHRSIQIMFSIQSMKKLLYLKYDKRNQAIYVSTLNYVYVCFLAQLDHSECKVLMSGFQSARGLYLDNDNNYLYAVDHKKKQIIKTKIENNLIERFDTKNPTWDSESSTVVINSQSVSGLGDVFNLCFYKQNLIWTEFSGKIKTISNNSPTNYEVLFSTNEYTYAIVLMNNATMTTSGEDDFIEDDFSKFDKFDSDDYVDLVGVKTTTSHIKVTSTTTTTAKLTSSTVTSTTPTTPTTTATTKPTTISTTTTTTTSTTIITTTSTLTTTTTTPTTTITSTTTTRKITTTPYLTTTVTVDSTRKPEDIRKSPSIMPKLFTFTITVPMATTGKHVYMESMEKTSTKIIAPEPEITELYETTTPEILPTTRDVEYIDRVAYMMTTVTPTIDVITESGEEEYESEVSQPIPKSTSTRIYQTSSEATTTTTTTTTEDKKSTTTTPNVQLNLRRQKIHHTINTLPKPNSEIFRLSEKTMYSLNIALYVISSLLCFSLIVNIILLYITKIRRNRGKLILNSDLCNEEQHMKSEIPDLN